MTEGYECWFDFKTLSHMIKCRIENVENGMASLRIIPYRSVGGMFISFI